MELYRPNGHRVLRPAKVQRAMSSGVIEANRITSTEKVIIPINATLLVQDAYMFAVTIEKPDGVVVSSRERLPLVAKVE